MTAEDHYYLGLELFGAGKLEEAIAEFRSALAINPRFTDALHGLVQAYFAKNDFDNAIGAARQILELDGEDVLAWATIARACERRGMTAEARQAAEKARTLGKREQFEDQATKEESP